MSLETWLAFAAVSAAILASPGSVVMLIVSYTLGRGRKSMLATIPAAALGTLVAMSIVIPALGWLLVVAPEILDPVRWIGGAYLVFVTIRSWRAPGGATPVADNDNLPEEKPLAIMRHAFVMTGLDRRSYASFVALLAPFLKPAIPLIDQAAVFVATFLGLAVVSWLAAAISAERVHRFARKHS
ncbi:MAG: LysE family translocator, partial [Allorhizobium sp.]